MEAANYLLMRCSIDFITNRIYWSLSWPPVHVGSGLGCDLKVPRNCKRMSLMQQDEEYKGARSDPSWKILTWNIYSSSQYHFGRYIPLKQFSPIAKMVAVANFIVNDPVLFST